MALYQSLTKNGQKLFQHRSFIPLVLYPIAIATIFLEKDTLFNTSDIAYTLICIAISLFGLVIRALVIGYVPRKTSGRNTTKQQAETLNKTGIYSTVRHPLYFGNLFMWLGIVFFVGHLWLALVCILVFWIYYERIMLTEEDFLIQKFGDQYHEWAKETPAFFPNFAQWTKPTLAFSWRKVIRREHRGLVAVLLSMGLLHVVKNYAYTEELVINKFWVITTAASACFFIFIRIIIKATNILRTPGR